jgi:hypothetical protein
VRVQARTPDFRADLERLERITGAEQSAGVPWRRVPRQRTPTLLRDRLVSDTKTSTAAAKSTGVKVDLRFSAGVSAGVSLLLTTSLLGWLQVGPC